jgi:hypothetical protein
MGPRSVAFGLLALAILAGGAQFARRARMARTPSSVSADSPTPDDVAAALERALDSLDAGLLQVQEISASPAPERDEARVRFLLDARSEGSYFLELLDSRKGWNYRWPDRPGNPMRIWVQDSPLALFDRAYIAMVRDALSAWSDVGLPILFAFTPDSAAAEVLVTWVERFDERATGRTQWVTDQHGWIVRGNIELALRQPEGTPLDANGIRAIARHEFGHLLGLDHTRDTTNVMSAQVWVTELSEADRRTIRLVYDLPPGRLVN